MYQKEKRVLRKIASGKLKTFAKEIHNFKDFENFLTYSKEDALKLVQTMDQEALLLFAKEVEMLEKAFEGIKNLIDFFGLRDNTIRNLKQDAENVLKVCKDSFAPAIFQRIISLAEEKSKEV